MRYSPAPAPPWEPSNQPPPAPPRKRQGCIRFFEAFLDRFLDEPVPSGQKPPGGAAGQGRQLESRGRFAVKASQALPGKPFGRLQKPIADFLAFLRLKGAPGPVQGQGHVFHQFAGGYQVVARLPLHRLLGALDRQAPQRPGVARTAVPLHQPGQGQAGSVLGRRFLAGGLMGPFLQSVPIGRALARPALQFRNLARDQVYARPDQAGTGGQLGRLGRFVLFVLHGAGRHSPKSQGQAGDNPKSFDRVSQSRHSPFSNACTAKAISRHVTKCMSKPGSAPSAPVMVLKNALAPGPISAR